MEAPVSISLPECYEPLRQLGSGRRGEVWHVMDMGSGEEHALRVIEGGAASLDALRTGLQREFAVARALPDSHVLQVDAPRFEDGLLLQLMPLGTPANDRDLRASTYASMVPLLIDAATSLERVHALGIAGVRLHPANLLRTPDGRGVLAGFHTAVRNAGDADRAQDFARFATLLENLLRAGDGLPPRVRDLVARLERMAANEAPRSWPAVIERLSESLFDTARLEGTRAPAAVVSTASFMPAAAPSEPEAAPAAGSVSAASAPISTPVPAGASTDAPTVHGRRRHGGRRKRPTTVCAPTVPAVSAVSTSATLTAPSAPTTPVVPTGPAADLIASAQRQLESVQHRVRALGMPRLDTNHFASLAGGRGTTIAIGGGIALLLLLFVLSLGSPDTPIEPGTAIEQAADGTPATGDPAPLVAASPAYTSAEAADRLAEFDERLALWQSRAAERWGGNDWSMAAQHRAAAVTASTAGDFDAATRSIESAQTALDAIEARAPDVLQQQLRSGEQALDTLDAGAARAAFTLAAELDPGNARAIAGRQRAARVRGVLPLIEDARVAEAQADWPRAIQDYAQALALDPQNPELQERLERARGGLGTDTFGRQLADGYAALGAGQLDRAVEKFEQARARAPDSVLVTRGLEQAKAALRMLELAPIVRRARALEEQGRWPEANAAYGAALEVDPADVALREGHTRTRMRADLAEQITSVTSDPGQLADQTVRARVSSLVERARVVSPEDPIVRAQITRLERLLPEARL